LHDQRPDVILDERPDGRPLIIPKPGIRAGQRLQTTFGFRQKRAGRHIGACHVFLAIRPR
jgi:hypothetical protein